MFKLNNRGEVDWFWLFLLAPAVIYAVGEIAPKFTGRPDYEETQRICKKTCEPKGVQEFSIIDKTVKCVCAPQ